MQVNKAQGCSSVMSVTIKQSQYTYIPYCKDDFYHVQWVERQNIYIVFFIDSSKTSA